MGGEVGDWHCRGMKLVVCFEEKEMSRYRGVEASKYTGEIEDRQSDG